MQNWKGKEDVYCSGRFRVANSKWNKSLESDEELLCQIMEPECSNMEQALSLSESKHDLKNDPKTVSLLRRVGSFPVKTLSSYVCVIRVKKG